MRPVARITSLAAVFVMSAALSVPAIAAPPPVDGEVVEGQSVPGAALGDTRAEIDASFGSASFCQGPTDSYCTWNSSGNSVSVRYRGGDGGEPTAGPSDVAYHIDFSGYPGWVTTAGVSTASALADREATIAAYPDAELTYGNFGLYSIVDRALGVSIIYHYNPYSNFTRVIIGVSHPVGVPDPDPDPDPAPDPVPDPTLPEAGVDSLSLRARGNKMRATGTVEEEDGGHVGGATVTLEFGLPDGSTVVQQTVTDTRGRLSVSVATDGDGLHTVTVTDIDADGHVFDGDEDSASVTVG